LSSKGACYLSRVFHLVFSDTGASQTLLVLQHLNLHFQVMLVLNHALHNLLMLLLALKAHALFSLKLGQHLFNEALLVTAHLLHYFPRYAHVYLFRLLPLDKTVDFVEKVFQLGRGKLPLPVKLNWSCIIVERWLCLLVLERSLQGYYMFFQFMVAQTVLVSLLLKWLYLEIFWVQLQLHFHNQIFVLGDYVLRFANLPVQISHSVVSFLDLN
jgi:hypothetical protein